MNKREIYQIHKAGLLDFHECTACGGMGLKMIVFDRLWKTMKKRGVSTYMLREKCDIDSKTIRRLRANENIETKTLNKLCAVLSCQVEDIAEYKAD